MASFRDPSNTSKGREVERDDRQEQCRPDRFARRVGEPEEEDGGQEEKGQRMEVDRVVEVRAER